MATKKQETKADAPVTRRRVVAAAAPAPATAPAAEELAPPPASSPAPAGPATNGPPDEAVNISAETQARIDAFAKLADAPKLDLNPAAPPAPSEVEKAAEITVSAPPAPAPVAAPAVIHVEVPASQPDQELYERFSAEPHVKCLLAKDVKFTLPNHQIKDLKAGVRMLPRSWATHWYMVASGVTLV